MASAKYLEEALSADVDESAVNAIVGSLETQLVTTTPTVSSQQGNSAPVNQNHVNSSIANGGTVSSQKHGVTNGGPGSINILNTDASKSIATSTLQSSNVVHPSVVNTVVASLHGGVPPSGYINQVSSTTSQSGLSTLTKPPDSVKLVYPSGSQTLNNRVAFQPGGLPNGNLGLAPLSSQAVLNAVTSVQNIVTQAHSQTVSTVTKPLGNVIGVEHGKPQAATLVIKAGGNPSVTQGTPLGANVVTVPMTVNSSMTLTGTYVNTPVGTTTTSGMSGVVTLAKPVTHTVGTPQTLVGSPPTTILPANVQIVNVNTVRPGTPGQQGQKNLASRVVIGAPHMVGARPGQPGQITLQTLQGLQAGTQGHLLLKTESGQYQLLRVGPAPTTPGAAIAPSATASLPNAATYRIQSVPAGAVAVNTTTAAAMQASQPPALTSTQNAVVQRTPVDTTKEKCRKFLANLLELSSREPKAVERNVRTLIQELIDTKVEPEEFCDRLERLLNASPQPCLIGFLKKSLPLLRQSLVTKELVIEGIRPPPHTVLFSISNSANVVPQLQPVRAQVPATRMVTTTSLRPQSPVTTSTPTMPSSLSQVRVSNPSLVAPPLHLKQTNQITNKITTPQIKPPIPVHLKPPPITKAAIPAKPVTPSILPKPTTKEKEKKLFSSAGYTGDDDINDVAAMGGVNLAEESQRILGSTEFVGTQIRSCKDEVFLHTSPLQHRIRQIVAKHGLDEPPPEVTALISHACQERLRNLIEKLGVIAEHRIDVIKPCHWDLRKSSALAQQKLDNRYEVTQDVKGQLKFLEELDRVERKRHEEHERELLLRAAKSRSKSEVPEQAKLKAKAKEMLRAEMEELRQQEANLTALQAIGPRKKPKVDIGAGAGNSGQSGIGNALGLGSTVGGRTMVPIRPRLKRVNIRDLLFLLEQEKDTCRSALLYRAYLK